jgi:hypothetical protein
MTRKAKQYLSGVKKVGVVRRAEGSPPRGEGKVGPGKMTSVGSRFISELFNPKKAAEDVENVGRSYLDMLSAYNTFLYKQSPEEQAAFVASLPSKTREAIGSAATALRDLPQTAKRAVEEATPESTAAAVRRFGVESAMDPTRLVKSTAPVTSQIVRPRNQGLVLDIPGEKPMGYVPQYLNNASANIEAVEAPQDQKTAMMNFFNSQARNYLTRQYGTPDDPIMKGIVSGKLTNEDLQRFGRIPSYMTKAAKEGKTRVNPETGESRFYPSTEASQALRDINKTYDMMTGMRGAVFDRGTIGSPRFDSLVSDEAGTKQSELRDSTIQQLIDQGVPRDQINQSIGLVGYKSPEFVAADKTKSPLVTADYMGLPKSLEELFLQDPNKLPKAFRTAIEKGEPIYDINPRSELNTMLAPKELVRYLRTLSPEKIKNLRFDDAVKGSLKLQEEIAERKQFVQRISDNKPVPDKVFLEGVSAPIVTYGKESQYPGFTWRRITDPEATTIEGAYVGHSVGGFAEGGRYGPKKHKEFVKGDVKIYSLRDERGRPVTTVEVFDIPGSPKVATQIRGAGRATGNTMPKPYGLALVDLFNDIGVTSINELDVFLPPEVLAYKKQKANETPINLRGALGAPQRIGDAPQPEQNPAILQGGAPGPVNQGIGQLPINPLPQPREQNPGFIEAMRRRLLGDQD